MSRHAPPPSGKFTVYPDDRGIWQARGPGINTYWDPADTDEHQDHAQLCANAVMGTYDFKRVASIDHDRFGGRFRYES